MFHDAQDPSVMMGSVDRGKSGLALRPTVDFVAVLVDLRGRGVQINSHSKFMLNTGKLGQMTGGCSGGQLVRPVISATSLI